MILANGKQKGKYKKKKIQKSNFYIGVRVSRSTVGYLKFELYNLKQINFSIFSVLNFKRVGSLLNMN